MAVECGQSLQLCAIRLTLLDSLGNVDAGPDNSYVSDRIISVSPSPDVEAGTTSTLVGGCDCTLGDYRGNDKLKRFLFSIETGSLEFAMLNLMIGGTLISDAGDPIGIGWPGPIECGSAPPNVAFEFWTKHWVDDSQDATWPWLHHCYPSTYWMIGEATYENDFARPVLNGFSRQNLQWGQGPYGDGPGFDIRRGGVWLSADALPTATCDFQTVSPGS